MRSNDETAVEALAHLRLYTKRTATLLDVTIERRLTVEAQTNFIEGHELALMAFNAQIAQRPDDR